MTEANGSGLAAVQVFYNIPSGKKPRNTFIKLI